MVGKWARDSEVDVHGEVFVREFRDEHPPRRGEGEYIVVEPTEGDGYRVHRAFCSSGEARDFIDEEMAQDAESPATVLIARVESAIRIGG